MFTIIKNANVFTPAPVGKKDILICGETIAAIEDSLDASVCRVKFKLSMSKAPRSLRAFSISMFT